MAVELWIRCNNEDCDARWRGTEDEKCWACGGPGSHRINAAPRTTSNQIVSAMTNPEWERIRKREGLD